MDFFQQAGVYLVNQGPWAVMCGVLAWFIYKAFSKLIERLLTVIEGNTAAFARVEAVMDKVLEKLNV